jgi:16S rRNA (guanine527-N7)-methyltransferase
VARLASDAVVRGVIGPREVPRLWDRHVLNCAVLTELVPLGARVVDVGSGAGLPGVALACRRADLRVDLVESLARRIAFLTDVVSDLGLVGSLRVIHGRAEDEAVRSKVGDAEWVTARAVAPLDRLVRWCLPLLQSGGTLLAMKGERAKSELQQHEAVIRRMGGVDMGVVTCGGRVLDTPTTVVVVHQGSMSGRRH